MKSYIASWFSLSPFFIRLCCVKQSVSWHPPRGRARIFLKLLLKNPHNETSSPRIKLGPRERMRGPKERSSSPCGKESRGWSAPEASSDIGNDARGIRKLSAPAYSCIRARTHARFLKPYNPGNVLGQQRRAVCEYTYTYIYIYRGERSRDLVRVNYRAEYFGAVLRGVRIIRVDLIWRGQ